MINLLITQLSELIRGPLRNRALGDNEEIGETIFP